MSSSRLPEIVVNIPSVLVRVGDLRLRLPQPIKSYTGTINATQIATQCVQLVPPIRTDMPAEMLALMEAYTANLAPDIPQGEDCRSISIRISEDADDGCLVHLTGLTIDVQVPAGTTPDAKLPVIAVSDLNRQYGHNSVDTLPD